MVVAETRPLPEKALVAMIAVLPLPGAPRYAEDDVRIVEQAAADLEAYKEAGVDCILLENSHDLPYIKPPLPAAAIDLMEHIAHEARRHFKGPIGLQLLEAANEQALELAHRARLDFLRVEGYVFAHVGGAGLIEGCAGRLHRLRAQRECRHLRIFGDIKKKHCSHALTADLDIVDVLRQAEFFLADGVVVTGARTGAQPDVVELRQVQDAARVPVWVGSGMTPENLDRFLPHADGFIVGSTFRKDGAFLGRLEPDRLRRFVDRFRAVRGW